MLVVVVDRENHLVDGLQPSVTLKPFVAFELELLCRAPLAHIVIADTFLFM